MAPDIPVRTLVVAASLAFGIATVPVDGAQGPFEVADLNGATTDGMFGYRLDVRAEGIGSGGQMYFTADDGIHGDELWRTDGTAGGTSLVADICPGSCSSEPGAFAVLGGRVFFHADDGVHGPEL